MRAVEAHTDGGPACVRSNGHDVPRAALRLRHHDDGGRRARTRFAPRFRAPQLQPGNAHLSVSGSCVRLHAYVIASSQARVPMVCVRASYGDAQVPICDLNGNRLFTLVMATPGRKTVRI